MVNPIALLNRGRARGVEFIDEKPLLCWVGLPFLQLGNVSLDREQAVCGIIYLDHQRADDLVALLSHGSQFLFAAEFPIRYAHCLLFTVGASRRLITSLPW